ncbi:P1 family peptidase [Actinacidiphila bryophytorum]|uniref:Pantetheine hydrolase n=1 Tax=Actinacidiphila bryophytorum TaxID=1436133 RepID=A0A9W4H334_9ACTN|nr:P1 family peptidase [Actinacidiphila bryophytorum]MBM9437168.1 P1 family peptidase [Actinacidiphila bryophytorum]MBN6542449.1 P1 family peptidase [Actinacidiphila bryophytorum]CAG7646958.1 Putative pantetheine hydrolase [Actinacidiphila bryophytorum]
MDDQVRRGAADALTDVAGLRVGHAGKAGGGWLTGVTVVLAPPGGAVTAVDVRGGGPGTRETDALDPRNLVPRVEAVVLTGGSAYGLDAASGVAVWLEEQGRGFPVGGPGQVVPVVPAAALFDLGRGGDWGARPGPALGRAAVEAAAATGEGAQVAQGSVGAGTGAVAGDLKGGVGTASLVLPSGATVAALAVVNASGSVVDPDTGALWAGPQGRVHPQDGGPGGVRSPLGGPLPPEALERARARLAAAQEHPARPLNTTLAVVATDAVLTRAQAHKLAGSAHDGLARAVRPVHLLSDGDTVFAMSTGRRPLVPQDGSAPADPAFGVHVEAGALDAVLAAGADALTRAVRHAVLAAETVEGPGGVFPSYLDVYRRT